MAVWCHLRGNHDSSDGAELVRVFPRTQTGLNNATPADALAVSNPDAADMPPAPVLGAPFTFGSNFSSPASMAGKTYSFDHKNVRFVLLDQFDGATNTIQPQQSWISSALASKPADSHAFVFGHKGLITEGHVDNLFGASPAADPAGTDAFIRSLSDSDVRYYIGGHDHMHDRTQVWTTDGSTAKVTELVCASDSSKFYFPNIPSNDQTYDVPAFGRTRQTPFAQELNHVGFYIFTVDGLPVTVDYYSAVVSPALGSGEYLICTTKWVNAVDLDIGGNKKFVRGPWRAGCGLGTYGIDARTKTAWAVVNHEGEFRVGHFDACVTDFLCALERRHGRPEGEVGRRSATAPE